MADVNISKIYLMNVPLESDYNHTIYFNSASEQFTYFDNRVAQHGRIFDDFSYQRKEGFIRVPLNYDEAIKYNYVMYRNTAYSSKWFYAFVTDIKFVNDGRTDLYIETDVIQTWMFDYNIKPSFIEREHTNDDSIGSNTIPETVEHGEYICDYSTDKKGLISFFGIIVGATIDFTQKEDGKFKNANGTLYNSVYSGLKYTFWTNLKQLNDLLVKVAEAGQSDSIVSMFMCPQRLVNTTAKVVEAGNILVDALTVYSIDEGRGSIDLNWNELIGEEEDLSPNAPTLINGYEPKNKKLLTYPYCYLLADNNSGGANVYHYELFKDGKPDFIIKSALTPGMSIRMIPKEYNGVAENNSEGLNLGKFPVCAWNTDVYTNWLTQNAINIPTSFISAGVSTVTGAVSGAVAGSAIGGVGAIPGAIVGGAVGAVGGVVGIANTVSEIYQHSLVPPTLQGNVNSGDVTFAFNRLTFTLYQMNIKKEYAQLIDEYFSMFGYKTNRVKTPNKNHRRSWWYTKTIDVNIDGAIPNEDMRKIKDCYNKGITFWRKETIGQYANDNSIGTGW